jgi:hypothetical protein
MDRGRVGEDRGSKEMDGCPLTGGMHRDEVRVLGYAVDDIHNCVVAMGFRQFNYEVNTDHVPWCLRCLQRVELTDRLLTLHFCPVAQITSLDADANVVGHLGPPVVA